jgi:hypothetical protein
VLIDVNANLFRWPTRRLALEEAPPLAAAMKGHRIDQAWVGTLEGPLHRDLDAANARLFEACRGAGRERLLPFGSVNPLLPDWEEDLRRCHEHYRMRGIRLHPNYHGYRLDDPAVAGLWEQAGRRRLIVQIALRLDDTRFQHPLLCVPDVDPQPLAGLAKTHPRLPLVVLNWQPVLSLAAAGLLAAAGNVSFDMSMQEGIGGLETLLEAVPRDRVLFGSHVPLFTLDSARLKLRESELTAEQRPALEYANAQRLLAGTA